MWKRLETEDLKKILSQDEIQTLSSFAIGEGQLSAVQDAIDLVADQFRGAFMAKGYAYDTREHFIPQSYALPVLQYARIVAWSRFPNSPSIALDEVRKDERDRIESLLKNPYIGPDEPEWEHSSENPEVTGKSGKGSIQLPFLRLDDQLWHWRSLSCI